MRLPRDGGSATLLRADSLTEIDWTTTELPAIVRGLGTDREEKMVYAVDNKGRLIGIDLRAQRWRPYLQSARQLTSTADGVVLGLDTARRPLRLANRALTTYHATVDRGTFQLLGAPGTQIVAISAGGEGVEVVDEDGEARRVALPAGDIAGTWAGDLIAVTTDSGVVFGEPSGKRGLPVFVALRGNPTTSVFSPSGHRLYVARRKNDIIAIDRFSHEDVKAFPLTGTATAMRIDPTGRWLLAKPDKGDSVWVVDLVRWELATTLRTKWAEDLPLVVGGRTLVARDGKDVIAIDLTAVKPVERSRLADAGGDVFLAVPWAPAGVSHEVVVVRDSTPTDTQPEPVTDSVPPVTAPPAPLPVDPIPTAPTGTAASSVYLQVASSQNQDWAAAFAQQLKDGGFPAKVLAPKASGDPYRVVIGPYATRDEADAVGRRLGRPYFLLTPGSADS